MKCKLKQCIFYFDEESKLYKNRIREYNKINKMMNEVEKHLKKFAQDDKISCSHLKCKAVKLILFNVMTFKSHTAKVHKISLRA